MGLSVNLPAELLTVVGALVPLVNHPEQCHWVKPLETNAFLQGLILFSFAVLFHPLREYPGPFLAKITDAYGGYYVWHRCLHLRTYHDHVRYGAEADLSLHLSDFLRIIALTILQQGPYFDRRQVV